VGARVIAAFTPRTPSLQRVIRIIAHSLVRSTRHERCFLPFKLARGLFGVADSNHPAVRLT